MSMSMPRGGIELKRSRLQGFVPKNPHVDDNTQNVNKQRPDSRLDPAAPLKTHEIGVKTRRIRGETREIRGCDVMELP